MNETTCRAIVQARSDGVCERCGHHRGQSMHHRKNRSQGGKWTPSNIVYLCGDGVFGCHGEITNTRTEYYDRGWIIRRDDDPAAVPFDHWQWGPVLLDELGDYHMRGAA